MRTMTMQEEDSKTSAAAADADAGELRLDRMLSPATNIRKAFKVANAGARKGDVAAKRMSNFAWRQLYRDSVKTDMPPKRQRYVMSLPAFSMCDAGNMEMESLVPVRTAEQTLPCLLRRAMQREEQGKGSKDSVDTDAGSFAAKSFWPVALTCVSIGAAVVVPYISFLQRDPGGVLFFSFIVHVTVVAMHLPAAGDLIRKRRIPMTYHAAMALFWCLFTTLKSDAFVRLPTSLCVLLSNMRMMVGMLVQVSLFGKRFSRSQVLGAAIATAGIATAGGSMTSSAEGDGSSVSASFLIGLMEMLGSSLCLSLYSSTIKVAFTTYGESLEEQVFVTHLCALLVVFPSQWEKVGPRLMDLAEGHLDWGLMTALVVGVLFNVIHRRAGARLAGRAPNLLMAQLVQTMDGFVQLLLTSLLRAPPFPPSGFWGGSLVLVLGTLQYLRASGAPSQSSSQLGDEEAQLLAVDLFGSPLQRGWAMATAAAKHCGGAGSLEAARRENRAWRKMRMDERANELQSQNTSKAESSCGSERADR